MTKLYQNVNYKSNPTKLHAGDGLNTFQSPFYIKDSEASYNVNTFVKNYPVLQVRDGFPLFGTALTHAIHGIGNRKDRDILLVENDKIKYYSTVSGWVNIASIDSKRTGIIEFRTASKTYTYYANGWGQYVYDGSSVATVTGGPNTHILAVDDFRIYAALGGYLYYSALGDPTNWTTGGAGSTLLAGLVGDILAITKFGQDQIIAFSRKTMHVLYGDDPANFYQLDPIDAGVVGCNSLCTKDGILYFLDYRTLKVYDGSIPVVMPDSEKIQYYLDNMLICKNDTDGTDYTHTMYSYGKYILLSIPMTVDTKNSHTFVYDTVLRRWDCWNIGFKFFTNLFWNTTSMRYLIGISSDTINAIYCVLHGSETQDGAGTSIYWEHITKCFNFESLSMKKSLSAIYVHFQHLLESVGDYFKLGYSLTESADDFTLLKTFDSSSSDQIVKVQLPTNAIQSSNYFRLKFYGLGTCKIKGYELEYRVIA